MRLIWYGKLMWVKNVVKEKSAAWYWIFNGLGDHSTGFALQLSSSLLQVFMSLKHTFLKSRGGPAVSWSRWRSIVKWYRMPFFLDVSWLKLLLQICMYLPLRYEQVVSQGVAFPWLALDTIIYRCSCKIISFTVASFHQRNACPQTERWGSRAGDYMGRWYVMHKRTSHAQTYIHSLRLWHQVIVLMPYTLVQWLFGKAVSFWVGQNCGWLFSHPVKLKL